MFYGLAVKFDLCDLVFQKHYIYLKNIEQACVIYRINIDNKKINFILFHYNNNLVQD